MDTRINSIPNMYSMSPLLVTEVSVERPLMLEQVLAASSQVLALVSEK